MYRTIAGIFAQCIQENSIARRMNVNLMFIYPMIGCGFLSISVRFI